MVDLGGDKKLLVQWRKREFKYQPENGGYRYYIGDGDNAKSFFSMARPETFVNLNDKNRIPRPILFEEIETIASNHSDIGHNLDEVDYWQVAFDLVELYQSEKLSVSYFYSGQGNALYGAPLKRDVYGITLIIDDSVRKEVITRLGRLTGETGIKHVPLRATISDLMQKSDALVGDVTLPLQTSSNVVNLPCATSVDIRLIGNETDRTSVTLVLPIANSAIVNSYNRYDSFTLRAPKLEECDVSLHADTVTIQADKLTKIRQVIIGGTLNYDLSHVEKIGTLQARSVESGDFTALKEFNKIEIASMGQFIAPALERFGWMNITKPHEAIVLDIPVFGDNSTLLLGEKCRQISLPEQLKHRLLSDKVSRSPYRSLSQNLYGFSKGKIVIPGFFEEVTEASGMYRIKTVARPVRLARKCVNGKVSFSIADPRPIHEFFKRCVRKSRIRTCEA